MIGGESEEIPEWIKAAIRIGADLAEEQTSIRFLQDCIQKQGTEALIELMTVNPLDTKRVAWLQITARRAMDFSNWLVTAITNEEQALRELEEIDRFNAATAGGEMIDG